MKNLFKISLIIVFALVGNVASGQTYILWTGTGGNWNTPANWSNGNIPDAITEIAVFNGFNGIVNNSNNDFTIGGISIVGSNLAIFQGTSNSRTIALNGNFASVDELSVLNSNLTVSGFTGGGRTFTLALSNNTNNNAIITNSTITSQSPDLTTNNSNGLLVNNAPNSNFIFSSNSSYVYNNNGGSIPLVTWQTGSTCSITGIVGNTPGGFDNQVFSNLVWNCPNQATTNGDLDASTTILGTFTLQSTGSGRISLGNTGTRGWSINNFTIKQ